MTDNSTKSPQKDWMVSFGDLLTLLLCFFIAIIATGPLSPFQLVTEKPVTTRYPTASLSLEEFPVSKVESGTTFADSSIEDRDRVLVLSQEAFSGEVESLSKSAAESLAELLSVGDYEVSQVRLETCSAGERQDRGARWFSSLGRALSLRSQVLDAGVDRGNIELRLLGGHCEALQTEEAAARIIVTAMRTRHG